MQAKKPETRAKNDKLRQEHIDIIKSLYTQASKHKINSIEWISIMTQIDKLEKQLEIYDKEMGYE